jgi:hypothetical protein
MSSSGTELVEHRTYEEAAGPGIEPLNLVERGELVTRDEFHERRLHRVLEIVSELRVAPAAEVDPPCAKSHQHRLQARVWNG